MSVDEIALVSCSPEDNETLALIGCSTFLESFAGILQGKAIVAHCRKHHSAEAYASYLCKRHCQAWLAVVKSGEAPVGYAMLSEPDLPLSDLGPRDIELKRIYLFSRFHGAGVGKMLVDKVVDASVAMGMQRLLLGVFAENSRAIAFYKRNGFAEVGGRTFYVGDQRCEDLILGKLL